MEELTGRLNTWWSGEKAGVRFELEGTRILIYEQSQLAGLLFWLQTPLTGGRTAPHITLLKTLRDEMSIRAHIMRVLAASMNRPQDVHLAPVETQQRPEKVIAPAHP
jgi:hypothetical protein